MQSFGYGPIAVIFLIGGYVTPEIIFCREICSFYYINRNDCSYNSMFNCEYLNLLYH